MIFASKNEEGIEKWRLIKNDVMVKGFSVTVTRRIKPARVGAEVSVQPNRGVKGVARILIKDVVSHKEWFWWKTKVSVLYLEPGKLKKFLDDEAHREGFASWDGLLRWFATKKIDINDTYRIEFEKVKS